MIDHNHQLIFTHIARCGGTYIEACCVGIDWWYVNPHTKHLPAQIAKKLYAPYWSAYYKFALIRNPFDRFRSMYAYKDHYDLTLNENEEIELDGYCTKFGYPIAQRATSATNILERSLNTKEKWHRENVILYSPSEVKCEAETIYGNLLTSGVECYKMEEMNKLEKVLRELGVDCGYGNWKMEKSAYKPKLSEKSISLIQEIARRDFETYDYSPKYNQLEMS